MYYYNCFEILIINRWLKNKDAITDLTKIYGIKKVVMSVYYLKANEIIINYNYKSIFNTISKILNEKSTKEVQNLPKVL